MFKTKIRVYACRPMTNRIKEEVVKEARADKDFLEKAGFKVLCPVIEEDIRPTGEVLKASKDSMVVFWPRDKFMIRQAHVVLDMGPLFNSEGVKHELGYARYFLYKPIIRVFPLGKVPSKASVAWFEDDFICDSLEEAVEYIYRVHGTLWKRLQWRTKLYWRCLPNMIKCWFGEWK